MAGLASAGVDVLLLGVLPTPGVAYLTGDARRRPRRDDLGEPQPDARQRHQVPRARRAASSTTRSRSRSSGGCASRGSARRGGGRRPGHDVRRRRSTTTSPTSSAPRRPRSTGSRSSLDCAHGRGLRGRARARCGRRRRGRRDPRRRPTGSTSTTAAAPRTSRSLQEAVLEHGADVGLRARRRRRPLPGGRPRGHGRRRRPDPGDPRASRCASRDRLAEDTVVATVMSNLGFVQAMREAGIGVEQTKVGDRYVLEAMNTSGYVPRRRAVRPRDPERPRHHRRRHPDRAAGARADGDDRAGRSRTWPSVMTRLPQVLVNVPGVDKSRADDDAVVAAAVAEEEAELAGSGRVLLRPSGTEPLVRVMVEAPSRADSAQRGRRPAGRRRTEPAGALSAGAGPGPASMQVDPRDDAAHARPGTRRTSWPRATDGPSPRRGCPRGGACRRRGSAGRDRAVAAQRPGGRRRSSARREVMLPLKDNLEQGRAADVHTHPDHRRRGHATAMLARTSSERVVAAGDGRARRDGRLRLRPQGRRAPASPGVELLRGRGFTLEVGEVQRTLRAAGRRASCSTGSPPRPPRTTRATPCAAGSTAVPTSSIALVRDACSASWSSRRPAADSRSRRRCTTRSGSASRRRP